MTPEQIAQNAAALRNAGMPDSLNRWLKMTPEAWDANEAFRSRMRNNMATIGRKEQQLRDARIELSKRGPLTAMKEAASVPKVTVNTPNGVAVAELGPGESVTVPAADAAHLPPEAAKPKESVMNATATKTTKNAKPATPAKKPAGTRKPKAAASKKAAQNSARTPVNTKTNGVRPDSKLAMIVRLLQRSSGCTTADVLEVTGWPAVSMPQQAKAAGIEMVTEKVGRTTTYWAKGHEPERLQKPTKA